MNLDSSSVTVRTHLSIDDWRALQRAFRTRCTQMRGWKAGVVAAVVFGLVGALVETMFPGHRGVPVWYGLYIGIGATYLGLLILGRMAARRMIPDNDGVILGEFEMSFSPEVIRVTGHRHEASYRWAGVSDVALFPQHIFVWVDRVGALIVPVRDLPASVTPAEALARFRAWVAASKTQEATPATNPESNSVSPVESTPVAPPEMVADRVANPVSNGFARPGATLLALWRLCWARRVDGAALRAADITILAIGVATLGLWIGLDRLHAGPRAQFAWWSLGELGWLFVAPLVLAWISARASHPRVPMRQALTLVVAGIPLIVAAVSLAGLHPGVLWSLMVGLIATVLAIGLLMRGLIAVTGFVQNKAAALVICGALAMATAANYLELRPSVWYTPTEDPAEALATWRNGEHLLFEQPAMIDAELARINPPADDSAAAYLVGFAGVGEQRVFAGEVSLAARLLGERYGAEHRTLLLLNDQRDLESKPLATVWGLERALTGVGSRMRRDRDVLFLFLSSHGSTEALSVSNSGLPLQQLSGKDLAAALKASGIRWKVIVISACHAGAFIAPLRDDNTIILTAAAADRTSFGCSDDRDLTYFGEAFYRDALPGAATLEAAFDQARKAIADRERAEKITPSNPQAFFGPAMAEKLKELESVRANAGSTRIAGPI